MEHQMKLITSLGLLVIATGLIDSCYGYTFHVGGKNGWVVDPRESYNHWAEKHRFQVNDTLVFKYKKGMDSVLVVNGEDYEKCNKTNPIETLDDGNSVFKFTRSGPFFFISGQNDKCEDGQKLIIVVLAVRHQNPTVITPPPTIAPAAAPVAEPVAAPVAAPSSTVSQGIDGMKKVAPAPAPSSGVATTGSISLILGLSLISLVFKGF